MGPIRFARSAAWAAATFEESTGAAYAAGAGREGATMVEWLNNRRRKPQPASGHSPEGND
jgi:hypothetical protein